MADFVVTTSADEADNGATVASPGGTGLSLREAIALANADPSTIDTITFDASLSGDTLYLGAFGGSGEDLEITSSLTIDGDINGNGIGEITISASIPGGNFNPNNRVLTIDNGNTE